MLKALAQAQGGVTGIFHTQVPGSRREQGFNVLEKH